MKKVLSALILLILIVCDVSASECSLKMGYRSGDKTPFMTKEPNNTGFYTELYTLASKNIGCALSIIREPKKRILTELESGKIDFYPAYNFTSERAKTVYYISTGLKKKNIGISHKDLPEIVDLSQLKGYTALVAVGSLNHYQHVEGVVIHRFTRLGMDRTVELILGKRADFYYSNYDEYLYYVKLYPEKKDILKVHHYCCGEEKDVYLAFSKKSPLIKEIPNHGYVPETPVSPTNPKTILETETVAYKFARALKKMADQGVTQALYDQYFK